MMHLFTETYIKMMRDSPIQDEWIPTRGHYYYSPDEAETLFCIEYDYPYRGEGDFWLPLDHDWWERIGEILKPFSHCTIITRNIRKWNLLTQDENDSGQDFYADTILELLALYVHQEKWGLTWDGGKRWVKKGE